jgi:hypothetical protein
MSSFRVPSAVPLRAPTDAETAAPAGIGERVARRFFELCENPRTRDRMMRVLQSSADSAVGGRLLVAVLSRGVFGPLLRSRRLDTAAATVEIVAAQLGGIAVLRYVTRMEPVASMAIDDLVAMVAPAIQVTLRPDGP